MLSGAPRSSSCIQRNSPLSENSTSACGYPFLSSYPNQLDVRSETIRQDKAAVIAYLRLKHKDPFKGYLLCSVVSRAHPSSSCGSLLIVP